MLFRSSLINSFPCVLMNISISGNNSRIMQRIISSHTVLICCQFHRLFFSLLNYPSFENYNPYKSLADFSICCHLRYTLEIYGLKSYNCQRLYNRQFIFLHHIKHISHFAAQIRFSFSCLGCKSSFAFAFSLSAVLYSFRIALYPYHKQPLLCSCTSHQ